MAGSKYTTHRRCSTPEYYAWQHMYARCYNPKHKEFKNYGARGVSVCGQWRDFNVFFADMGERPSPLHSLDRVDNNGNYGPENCRWATKSEQSNNKRTNRIIQHDGLALNVAQWARHLGLTRKALDCRLRKLKKRNLPPQLALY